MPDNVQRDAIDAELDEILDKLRNVMRGENPRISGDLENKINCVAISLAELIKAVKKLSK